jgi:putative ATP-binding cassette transporter
MFNIPINEQGLGLFIQMLRNFSRSEVGGKAIGMFALLILLLLFGVNGLNIVNSYVGRDFMTAIANRDTDAFVSLAALYLLVFAASTVVAVFVRYLEERLGLVWRDWMTRRFVELYLRSPTYYRMNDELIRTRGIGNPDQRIADDVRVFTATTLSFALMLLNGLFTAVAFSVVLWSISPWLFGAALVYAVAGSYFTVRLGSRLVSLNDSQLDKEAAFRSDLMHVRERAESVALLHREGPLLSRLMERFDAVAANFHKIILVNRNLNFFTTGYNYLVQIIPVLLIAPLFIRGQVEFGVVTQSAMAFAMLIGAISLIVTQFQSISSFAAVIQRLIGLWYTIELVQTETVSGLDMREEDDHIVYDHVTLRSAIDGRVLVQDLTLAIPHGTRVLVTGSDETARNALFKATAGLLDTGTGRIVRPPLDRILFLPDRPYLPPGTLRRALTPDPAGLPAGDDRIMETLRKLGIDSILPRAGGLDAEHEWDGILSVRDQQLVSFARVLLASPRFVVFDRPAADLNPHKAGEILNLLTGQGITYLTLGRPGHREGDDPIECYDAVLELKEDGGWTWRELRATGPG